MCESKYCCQIHNLECSYIAWPYRHTSDEKTFTNRNRLTQPFAFNRLLYTMMVHRHNISLIVWLGSNLIDMLLTIFDLKRFNLFNLIHVLTYAAIWIHQCQLIGWERNQDESSESRCGIRWFCYVFLNQPVFSQQVYTIQEIMFWSYS